MHVQQLRWSVVASAASDPECVLSIQGLQGEPGPKGDPGPYGLKGAKVPYIKWFKTFVLARFQLAFWWPAIRRYVLIITGRYWKGRRTWKTRKIWPTGKSGESVCRGRKMTRVRSVWCASHRAGGLIRTWISVLWQGDRGPPGNNGDKGERGDDVRDWAQQKKVFSVLFHRLYNIMWCVCVSGRSGAGWTSWGESKAD